jgi:predicted GH43/DUF377 family glycosyl hydrolase
MRTIITMVALVCAAHAQVAITAERLSRQPLLSPGTVAEDANGIFNPAAVAYRGKIVLLYREQDANGTSRIGYADSRDGVRFTRRKQPVLVPEAEYERGGGVEDPRITRIGDTYYLTYTGYNKRDAQLCLATSKDLIHWTRRGVILPAYQGKWNVGWTKAGAILPEKINGKYWMYFLGTGADKADHMGVAWSEDFIHWHEPLDRPVLEKIPGRWDARVMEPGPPPLITDKGILMIYNAADEKLVYTVAWVLFDRNDPTKVIARAEQPFMRPELEWEKTGQVPNVVFVEGMVKRGKDWLIYYGGADKYIGGAKIRIEGVRVR